MLGVKDVLDILIPKTQSSIPTLFAIYLKDVCVLIKKKFGKKKI